ncbi:MAG: hypothetical protein Phog2KO_48160 [Phototrophicaceae bacterium]
MRNAIDTDVAEKFVEMGNEYAEHEQCNLALLAYNEVIRRYYNKLPDVYYRRGLVYKALEKYHLARDDFDEAIRLGVKHAEIYFHRACLLRICMRGIPQLALMDFDKAIRLNPDYMEAYYERGILRYEELNYWGAIEDFTKVIDSKPEDDLYNKRGIAYSETFQLDKAIADYTYIINRNEYERMHIIHYNRALTYERINQNELAIQDYTDVLKIKPDYDNALSARFDLYKRMGQHQKAQDSLKEITSD